MKKKTLLIVVISILVVLLIVAGVFAYLFLGTDIFKSDKELFAKYTSQVLEEDEFIPKLLTDYETRKDIKPYESNGKISANVEILADSATTNIPQELQSAIQTANNTNITFNGKVDKTNKKIEENFKVNYTDSVNLPFTFRQDGDRYGILVNNISESNFVAVDNNNIPALLQALGATNISGVPNKIEIPDIESLNLTDDEKTHIKETYITPMYEGISEDKFTKIENEDGTVSYELNLTLQEVKDILSQTLQRLSEDQRMIDKLNSIYSEMSTDLNLVQTYSSVSGTTNQTTQLTSENVLELKNDIDSKTITGGNLRIQVTENKRSTSKLALEVTEADDITSSNTNNTNYNTDYNTDYNSSYNSNNNLNNYTSSTPNTYTATTGETTEIISNPTEEEEPEKVLFEVSKTQADEASTSYTMNVTYNGINYITINMEYAKLNTDTPSEKITLNVQEPETAKMTYTLEKNLTFGNEVTIDGIDDTYAYVLNNHSANENLPFLMQYAQSLSQINAQHMTQIGYPTEAINPVFMWTLTPAISAIIQSQAENAVTNSNMGQEAATAYNSEFTAYEGNVTGSRVKTLIDTIVNHNLVETDNNNKIQVLPTTGNTTVNSSEINQNYTDSTYLSQVKAAIIDASMYNISFGKDSTSGKITTVYISPASTTTNSGNTTNNANTTTTNTVSNSSTMSNMMTDAQSFIN